MSLFSLFSGADLIGEFDTRGEAEQALDETIAADPSTTNDLAVVEYDESGERGR